MANYIGAIDQGTTSTRFIVFDRSGRIVSVAQKEHEQIYPQPGWVEHDANEIWRRTREVMGEALEQRALVASDLAAIGITNQRETTVVWDRQSGAPVYNALVWQDTRTAEAVAELARHGGCRPLSRQDGAAAGDLFQRAQNPLDSGQRGGGPRAGRRRANCCSATWTRSSCGI